jgi:RNA polymerase sigma-70 factor (ECF subfamily)
VAGRRVIAPCPHHIKDIMTLSAARSPTLPAALQSLLAHASAAPAVAYDFSARLLELVPQLRSFARTLYRNRDGADDLVQETITKAWEARAAFQPGTNLRAWLFVIERNAYFSAHRRHWRQVDWNEETMLRVLVTNGAQLASVELDELKRAMSLLPDEQCEALILIGAGGFSHSEAAALCGCAIGTMKSRLSRARRAIAASMSGRLPKSADKPGTAYLSIVREVALRTLQPRRAGRSDAQAALQCA